MVVDAGDVTLPRLGPHLVVINVPGYYVVAAEVNAVMKPIELDEPMIKKLSQDEYRVVLSWGHSLVDLILGKVRMSVTKLCRKGGKKMKSKFDKHVSSFCDRPSCFVLKCAGTDIWSGTPFTCLLQGCKCPPPKMT